MPQKAPQVELTGRGEIQDIEGSTQEISQQAHRPKKSMCVCVCWSLRRVRLSATQWTVQPARLLCPWDSPSKDTRVGYISFSRGDLPDPGIEPTSPALQADSLPSEPPGEP